MGTKKRPSWSEYLYLDRFPNLRDYPATGPSVGIVLTLVVLASAYVMLETLVGLYQSFYFAVHAENFGGDAEAQSTAIRNIGLALAAIIGVPFIVWRSVVAQKQVNVTEQGHITDRINKAVEGLGAEKKVDQIGRPVTIYFGEQDVYDDLHKSKQDFVLPSRSVAKREKWIESTSEVGEADGSWSREVTTWADEETRIEWEGTSLPLAPEEHLASKGEWQVFSRSEPNIEVRIGAILSLERIAQDSARDYIQIMEILFGYLRANSGRGLQGPENPFIRPDPLWRATPRDWQNWRKQHCRDCRMDVDAAVKVLSRNTLTQASYFSQSGRRPYLQRLDLVAERLQSPDFREADLRFARLPAAHLVDVVLDEADMRGAELQGAILQNATLKNTRLNGAEFAGTTLVGAILTDADLQSSHLEGADLRSVDMRCSYLPLARVEKGGFKADFGNADLRGAILRGINFEGARTKGVKFNGADLGWTKFDDETEFQGCSFAGAALKETDLSDVKRIEPYLKNIFFDGSVTLPGGITPQHPDWPKDRPKERLFGGLFTEEEKSEFHQAWRAWQREHHPDTLPDHLR